jgi:hypothetical protein
MKLNLRSLKKGQEIWAIVEESIAGEELVINFSGDLIRVQNKTDRKFRSGQRVLLQIQTLQPLKLKLLLRTLKTRSPHSLDVSI